MFRLLKRFMGWVTGSTLYRFLGNQFKRMGRSLRPSNWFSQRKKRGKRMRKPAALRVDQPRWYLRPFYFLGRQLKRLFHNLHPFILIPFLGRQGKRLIQAVWHSRLIRFLGDRLSRILRSLWFRLMAAFTAVILIMLFMVSGVISNITQREFGQYIRERNEYIRSVIPTLVPGQGVVVVDGRTFREVSEILEIPEIPEIPELPTLPVGGKISELPEASELVSPQEPPTSDINVDVNVDELVEEVIVDEIVVQIPGFEEILVPDSVEEQGLQFLGDVREATETAVIVGGIVSFVLGTMLFWQITRPLAKLRQATQDIAQGQTGVRVPVRRQDEMGKVGTAFNQMAIQIEQQEQVRKQMVADVAHELRTPLTVMKSNLEAMLDGLIHPT
ncbi:MAG: HAMP domain-containing protein, partial [Chloroflexi bacterium]|nr:HAMP domain-containing protein [Chloroflexota bacterium]